MKRWIGSGCLLAMVGMASFAFAESPFVGKWKLNQSKSDLTGSTITFSPASNGMIRETVAEGSYTFKPDGQSYPSLFGDTESWQKLSGNSWNVTIHGAGGYTYMQSMKISDDGHTLTTNTKGTNPDGSALHDEEVFTRVAGGKGLMGKWKTTKVKMNSDRATEIAPYGNDGITWSFPEIKGMLQAKFDGKDYALVGPSVPKGMTVALKKDSPNSFSWLEKMNGKPMYKGTYTVEAGGKTMKGVSSPVGQSEPETAIFDKE